MRNCTFKPSTNENAIVDKKKADQANRYELLHNAGQVYEEKR